ELENVVERAVVLAREGSQIEVSHLPDNLADRSVTLERGGGHEPAGPEHPALAGLSENVFKIRVGTPLAEVEQRMLEETLKLTKETRTLAARLLGIDPKTVFRKLKAGEADDASDAGDDKPAS